MALYCYAFSESRGQPAELAVSQLLTGRVLAAEGEYHAADSPLPHSLLLPVQNLVPACLQAGECLVSAALGGRHSACFTLQPRETPCELQPSLWRAAVQSLPGPITAGEFMSGDRVGS